MTQDNREESEYPPLPTPPRGATFHAGAPRATRARRLWWWAFFTAPGWSLVLVGAWALTRGELLGLTVIFGGLTAVVTVSTARNFYRVGYATGSLQRTLDRVTGVSLDDELDRPRPHPADPSPLPHHPGEVAR